MVFPSTCEGGGGRGEGRRRREAWGEREHMQACHSERRQKEPALYNCNQSTITWMLRVANSTPIVDLDSRQNSFRVKRLSRLDLPTPESPISTTLNR